MVVAVAMSGGVDSTAAALILKKQGWEIIGLHMHLHQGSPRSWERAKRAAQEIGVPIHQVDLRQEFRHLVVEPFVKAYSCGRTPSPCPICNRAIKASLLFNAARNFGCRKLATGHYARITEVAGEPLLLKGLDRYKDQSYFLFMLTQDILRRTVFPLGRLTKKRVRELVRDEGISVARSEESQELCFIRDNDYRRFLREEGLESRPGPIVDLKGRIVGKHAGIAGFTVGQRRGLGVCGPRPLYVVRIDAARNMVVVGTREETVASKVRIGSVTLVRSLPLSRGEGFEIKVRSTAKPVPCCIVDQSEKTVDLEFKEPQSGVAPGQAAVLYDEERVVGGGWIEETDLEASISIRMRNAPLFRGTAGRKGKGL